MKYLRLFAGLPLLFMAGCWGMDPDDDVVMPDQPQYEAIVMDRDEFESAVRMMPPQQITTAGKIYIKDNFLFINDARKGFHVYNYTDPANPVPLGFLNVPGSSDLAMRDNVMYINQATDLLTVLYDNSVNTITVIKRNREVFPEMPAPNGWMEQAADDEVIIGWEQL